MLSQLQPDVSPDPRTPREILREFNTLLESAELLPAGQAKGKPEMLAGPRYRPRYKLELFDAVFYLTDQEVDENIGFILAYVGLRDSGGRVRKLYPRIFYKDSSLVWRVGTHFIQTEEENWIGKGDVKWAMVDGELSLCSAEETTNLPFELQAGLDKISQLGGKPRRNDHAVALILRNAPNDRLEPYADFLTPRRRAEKRYGRVNGGRNIASFRKAGDPSSLHFVKGFEPDFKNGLIDIAHSASRLYGGPVRKFRIASINGRIQYQFVAAPHHVWVNPPQSVTTDISIYGVRTLDVHADEDLFVPGFEYHFIDEDEDPPGLHTQIPEGYAGPASELDEFRADASQWIEALPVVREFRRTVLRKHKA